MAEKETGRVEAFSDGVFAIATTLLILEIKVPRLPHEAPPAALGQAMNLSPWVPWAVPAASRPAGPVSERGHRGRDADVLIPNKRCTGGERG